MIYSLARRILFQLPPETAHHIGLATLQSLSRLGPLNPVGSPANRGRGVELMGLSFPNRVGLAAGFDKDGECIDGMAALGFGFIEVGTVTPRPQAGNPRPRLFRLPQAGAIINRMGFNNQGIDALLERVSHSRYQGILGINIGKNRDTPVENALDDYRIGLQKAYPLASYLTVNISSPNTPGLRRLQSSEYLNALLEGLAVERESLAQAHGKRVPMAVKIAPDLEDGEIDEIASALLRHGMDGVIATNTTASRDGVAGLARADEAGGLSGGPLRDRSTAVVRRLQRRLQGQLPIIACGGIASVDDARAKLQAGAALVQIYTGLIYQGPGLIAKLVETI